MCSRITILIVTRKMFDDKKFSMTIWQHWKPLNQMNEWNVVMNNIFNDSYIVINISILSSVSHSYT